LIHCMVVYRVNAGPFPNPGWLKVSLLHTFCLGELSHGSGRELTVTWVAGDESLNRLRFRLAVPGVRLRTPGTNKSTDWRPDYAIPADRRGLLGFPRLAESQQTLLDTRTGPVWLWFRQAVADKPRPNL